MAKQFFQIAYKEVLFNFDNNAFNAGSAISVKMAPLMKFEAINDNDNTISLQLTLEYLTDDKTILKYAGVALFMADGWKDVDRESEEFKDFKLQIWTQTLGFFRGIVCEKVKGTEIERFFLPQMPVADIVAIPMK